MDTKNQPIKSLLLSGLLGLCASSLLMADDTEVYLGANQVSNVRPNLVFIIDTSGSMDTDVDLTSGSYDPSITYTGDGSPCDPNRVYWSTGSTPPSCGTSNYIALSSFTCDDASSSMFGATGSGYYVGRAARYNIRNGEDRWQDLTSWDHTEKVECEADWGIHGETTGSSNVYPADANDGGPWRSTTNNAIIWSNTGRTYTFYSANYLNWRETPGTVTTKTRLEIVQEVFSNLMDSVSNVNIAVMRFSSSAEGGYFTMPMQQLTDANRQDYKDSVNAFTASGGTPLAEALYESYLFYKGANVDYGDSSTPGTNVSSVLNSIDNSQYESPVEYQCQKNFTILLTDGDPTSDTSADSKIASLPGFSAVTGSSSCSGDCLDEMAQYMYNKDCSSTLSGEQNVITYTIGFATDQALLNNAATKGGGKYYTADDTAGLTDAFTAILTEILAINTSFTAPAVSVNAFNRSNHRNELYYALFRPNTRPNWVGNIKRYELSGDPLAIRDANGTEAVDANTGFTKTTAVSFWTGTDIDASDVPDGDNVSKGGAASRQVLPRTVYTYTGGSAPSNEALTNSANELHESNAAITKTMLGDAAMTDAARTSLLQWARGIDVQDDDSDNDVTDARRRMGDPLHTKPVLITYGGTDANPDITLFAATNEGYLHAIDTSDGSEVFAFMPQELLPNLEPLFDDSAAVAHLYGLDGPLTYWMKDLNGNKVILDSSNTLEIGESVYIYQGMRRGGKNYYALDVTNRAAPVLKWQITGGSGDFSELSQTWSAASKAKIKLNGVDKEVLIFGGGYDAAQDGNGTAQDDTEGRALFIIDAETGAKIWQAGPAGSNNGSNPNLVLSDMTNSIPSDVTVKDTNGDGYQDRIYVGDMRGQIWRFDIDNDNNTSASNLVTGGVIAKLGTDGSTADNRRFYYAPEVALSTDSAYINIAIGSGYRAHPLDTAVHDAFFVIRDSYVYEPLKDSNGDNIYTYVDSDSDGTPDAVITLSDLYDATNNVLGNSGSTTADRNTATAALSGSNGWYFWLNEYNGDFVGEKVLASPLAFEGKVQFTTFTPVAAVQSACAPSQGQAVVYEVYLKDASQTQDYDNDGTFTRNDRRLENLKRTGIPSPPIHVFTENGIMRCVGMECDRESRSRTPKKIRWSQD